MPTHQTIAIWSIVLVMVGVLLFWHQSQFGADSTIGLLCFFSPIIAVFILSFVIYEFSKILAHKELQQYLARNDIHATIEKVGMPPLRLWPKNHRWHSWAAVRLPDGSVKWVRFPNPINPIAKLLNKTRFEFFD